MKYSVLIGHISLISAALSLFFSILKRNDLTQISKPIIWLFLGSVIADVVSLSLRSFSINNLAIGNIFTLYQYVILFLIYYQEKPIAIYRVILVFTILTGLVNFVFIQTPLKFNSYTFYSSALVLLVLGITYLLSLVKNLPVDDVKKLPVLWVTFGTITYYSGTTFIFLFSNYLVANFPEVHQKLWVLHNFLATTKNLLFFIAIWVDFKKNTFLS